MKQTIESYRSPETLHAPVQWREFAEQHVHEVAKTTPVDFLERTPNGLNFFIKREDMQDIGSFKLRGAYIKALDLRQNDPERFTNGLVAASAGNHAQGVALAATELGTSAIIFMPEGTPHVKIEAVKKLGGRPVNFGKTVDESLQAAKEYATAAGAAFVHPFDDEAVIAGQGTIGTELCQQLPDVDTLVIQIGGGGLIAGIAQAVKASRPDIRIFGVQLEGCDAAAQSVEQGKLVRLDSINKVADGVAVQMIGRKPFETIRNPDFVEGIVRVTPEELGRTIKRFPWHAEPAGLLGYAGLLKLAEDYEVVNTSKNKTWATIASGCNADPNRINSLLEIAG